MVDNNQFDDDDIFPETIRIDKDEEKSDLADKESEKIEGAEAKGGLKGYHFAIGVAVLAAGWIFGPDLLSDSTSQPETKASTNIRSQQSYADLAPNLYSEQKRDSKTDENNEKLQKNKAEIDFLKERLTVSEAVEKKLSEQVAVLESQLAAKETQLTVCQAVKPAPKKQRVVSSTKRRVYKPKPKATKPVQRVNRTKYYSLNTVFNNQAWIQNKDRTYVVHVGDYIDGFRILRIDTDGRRVITSSGVIR